MSIYKKIFLIALAICIVGLNIALYTWNQSLKAKEVLYLANIPVEDVAFDRQGQVWVYGGGKLSVYKDGMPIQVFTEKDSSALGSTLQEFIVDNMGRVWVAPWGSKRAVDLAVFDGVKWLTLHPSSASSGSRGVIAISVDTKGQAWISIDKDGLYVIQEKAQGTYELEKSTLPISKTVESLVFDKQNRLWLGTRGDGIYIFDGKVLQNFNTGNSQILDNWNYSIAFDHQDRAWIASGTVGISVFDGENWTSYKDLGNNTISSFVVDGQGRVWADNSIVFDGETRKYYFNPSHFSYTFIADEDGNIWIPNENGVVIITPDSPQPLSYSIAIVSFLIASGSLTYLTILLMCIWLSVALSAWRSIGVALVGFPIYLFTVISGTNVSSFGGEYYNISRLITAINPGTLGTIGGILGGTIEILLVRAGNAKPKRIGLIGFIVGSGLGFCLLIANMAL